MPAGFRLFQARAEVDDFMVITHNGWRYQLSAAVVVLDVEVNCVASMKPETTPASSTAAKSQASFAETARSFRPITLGHNESSGEQQYRPVKVFMKTGLSLSFLFRRWARSRRDPMSTAEGCPHPSNSTGGWSAKMRNWQMRSPFSARCRAWRRPAASIRRSCRSGCLSMTPTGWPAGLRIRLNDATKRRGGAGARSGGNCVDTPSGDLARNRPQLSPVTARRRDRSVALAGLSRGGSDE